MGKCYCDYCDVFLTNDSVAVRKQHNEGNRHKHNVCEYYRQYIGEQLQKQIDDIVASFELRVSQGLITPNYALPAAQKNQSTHGQPREVGREAVTDDLDEKAEKQDTKSDDSNEIAAQKESSKGSDGNRTAADADLTRQDHATGNGSQQVETVQLVKT